MNLSGPLIEKFDRFGAHNYHPLPIVISRGKAATLWDVDGKAYLDFLSSYSAVNFGHSHPRLVNILQQQAEKLAVCSRAYHAEELSLFCEELAKLCGMEAVLPMNSGAEGVETAIKIARKWGYEQKSIPSAQATILAMKNNFHGRTISLISLSSEARYREHFDPFTPGFELCEFGDIESVRSKIDRNTAAVLIEPMQAEAGILVPPDGYLAKLRRLCDEQKVLLIFDEIQTGLGRTGRDFCFQHENVRPDVLILGKSLGGGLLPISAVVTTRKIMDVLQPGHHGSTFGGNPLACAVARESMRLLKEENLSSRAEKIGKRILGVLNELPQAIVKEVRGRGALIGVELRTTARPYCEELCRRGVLCKETHERTIRLAPPLILSEEDLEKGMREILAVLKGWKP